MKKKIKNALWWVIPLVVLVSLVIWISTLPKKSTGDIISSSGIHWHPELSIKIKGKDIEIPSNIGIGAVHNPMHTHDDSGEVHMEYGRTVRKDDTMLGRFFDVWGKDFSSAGIMGHRNGVDGTLKMFVNGEENFEFDKYKMKDGDKIDIVFE
jgi:hypothetical protein